MAANDTSMPELEEDDEENKRDATICHSYRVAVAECGCVVLRVYDHQDKAYDLHVVGLNALNELMTDLFAAGTCVAEKPPAEMPTTATRH